MKPILLNRTQLARHLAVAPATLAKRIADGTYEPYSYDGAGRPLFRKPAKALNARRREGARK